MSNTFTTEHGKYLVDLDFGTVRRIRHSLGVDLFALGEDEAADTFSDVMIAVLMIYECCKGQADSYGVSRDEFCNSIGPVADEAMNAFMDAVAVFFGRWNPKLGRSVRVLWSVSNRIQAAAPDAAEQAEAAIDATLETLFGKSPDTSESATSTS